MGIYLPCLFSKLRSFIKSMAAVFILIFLAEIIQVTLEIGSFDIDDLILNISGAAAAYGLWSVRPIRKFLGKLYLVRD
jgi:glycopeptide antibiotics resistance protein